MSKPQIHKRHSNVHLESIARIKSIPAIASGINLAGNVYGKIKRSNSLMNWSLDTAEQSLSMVTTSAKPVMLVLNKPISTIDQYICRGIDIIEMRVPTVNLPPELLYLNTREFMNNKIVRPVIKRAGSVTQIGSQAAAAAAETLDDALTVADGYVDHYLPADPADKSVEVNEASPKTAELGSKATRTFKHGARFSRKLQRRLTRRTLAEARALKNQGVECVHTMIYVMQLIVTDPKTAYKKSKELWAVLSLPEPENQQRPKSLEQLLVLLTRESARRIVHLMNAAATLVAKLPFSLGVLIMTISHHLLAIADATFKVASMTCRREVTESQISVLQAAVHRVNISTTVFLEKTAIFLAGRPKQKKLTPQNHNNHMTPCVNRRQNGID